MPSSVSKGRRQKAFDEGRRSAAAEAAQNPYDNPILRRLWDDGRAQQRAGAIDKPIPQLASRKTRAQRHPQNPPRPKPPARQNRPPRFGGGGSSGGGSGGRGYPRGR